MRELDSAERAPGRCRTALIALTPFMEERGAPLSLGYLHGCARQELGSRVDCRIFQYRFEVNPRLTRDILRDLESFEPHIVGFSCYCWNYDGVIALAKAIKRRWPGVRVIMGGPEAQPGRTPLLERGTMDALVLGEGEETFVELLRRWLEGRDWMGTPGTITFAGGSVVRGPRRDFIDSLDRIPSPWLSRVIPRDPKVWNLALAETTRGCPMDCSFCTWTNRRSKVRRFSDARVEKDLTEIVRLGAKRVFICDADIFIDRARGVRLARIMRRLTDESDVSWSLQVRAQHLYPEVLELTDHPGFGFGVGIESLSEEVLRLNGRGGDVRGIEATFAYLRRHPSRAELKLQLICTLPGETASSFRAGLDKVLSVRCAIPFVFLTLALPESHLAGAKKHLVCAESRPPYYVVSTNTITREEFSRLRRSTLELVEIMRYPDAAAVLRDQAERHGGSVTAAFAALRPSLGAGARSVLAGIWRYFERLPPWERGILYLQGRKDLAESQQRRLAAGFQRAAARVSQAAAMVEKRR